MKQPLIRSFISPKFLGLWGLNLVLSLSLVACASDTTLGDVSKIPPTVLLRDEPSELTTLKALRVNLVTSITLLENNQISDAKLAFKKFDNRWFDVLITIRANAKDSFRQMDDTVKTIEQRLLHTEDILVSEVISLLRNLEQDFSVVITKITNNKPVGTQSQKVQPLTVEEVEATSIKVREFLFDKTEMLVQKAIEFREAVKTRDFTKAKGAYEAARFEFEEIEFLAEAFKDFNIALDGRPEQMVKGEDDPNWTGFHPIEKAIYQDGRLDEFVDELLNRLVQDLKDFQVEIKIRNLMIKPPLALSGAASLIEEILSNKITGEEERYSHTDLTDFKANLDGALYVYTIFSPYVRRVNSELDDQIFARFLEVKNSITPFFYENNRAINYLLVNDDTRKILAQKVDYLADVFSKVPGTLGLKT